MSLQKYRREANLSKALEAAARLAKKVEEELFIDFDEAVKENEAKAIRVKFDGQVFNLPRTVPAWLPLFLNKSDGSDKDKIGRASCREGGYSSVIGVAWTHNGAGAT